MKAWKWEEGKGEQSDSLSFFSKGLLEEKGAEMKKLVAGGEKDSKRGSEERDKVSQLFFRQLPARYGSAPHAATVLSYATSSFGPTYRSSLLLNHRLTQSVDLNRNRDNQTNHG